MNKRIIIIVVIIIIIIIINTAWYKIMGNIVYYWKDVGAPSGELALHEKWSFLLKISSVYVTKFAISCGFGHIYWRNCQWKTLFFVQCENF